MIGTLLFFEENSSSATPSELSTVTTTPFLQLVPASAADTPRRETQTWADAAVCTG